MFLHFYLRQVFQLYEQGFGTAVPNFDPFRSEFERIPHSDEFVAIYGQAALYPMSHRMRVTIFLNGQIERSSTLANAWRQISEGVPLAPIEINGTLVLPKREHIQAIVPVLYLDAYRKTETFFKDTPARLGISARDFRRRFRGAIAGRAIEPHYADPMAVATHFLSRN